MFIVSLSIMMYLIKVTLCLCREEESAFDSCHEMEQLNEKLEKTRGIEMKQTMNHKEAERLDVMMDLTMTFIHQICYPSGQ